MGTYVPTLHACLHENHFPISYWLTLCSVHVASKAFTNADIHILLFPLLPPFLILIVADSTDYID